MEYRKETYHKPGRQISTSSPRDVRRRQQEKSGDSALISELQRQISDLRNQFMAGTGGVTPEAVDAEIRKAVKEAVKETKAYYEPLLAEAKSKEGVLRDKVSSLKTRLSESLEKQRKEHRTDVDKKISDTEARYNNTISSLEDRLRMAEDRLDEKNTQLDEIKAERDDTIQILLEEHTKKLEALTASISMEQLGVDDPDRPSMEEVFVDPLEEDAGADLEAHIILEDVPSKQKEKMVSKVNKLRDLMGSFADKE